MEETEEKWFRLGLVVCELKATIREEVLKAGLFVFEFPKQNGEKMTLTANPPGP